MTTREPKVTVQDIENQIEAVLTPTEGQEFKALVNITGTIVVKGRDRADAWLNANHLIRALEKDELVRQMDILEADIQDVEKW